MDSRTSTWTTHPSTRKPTAVVEEQVLASLFEAIGEGKMEEIKDILSVCDNREELLKKKDLQGLTPLKKSVALNKAEIERILVSYGAAPSVRDPGGRTALHTAVMQGRRELIAPLLVSKDSNVNIQDSHGWTPLHFAVRGKHVKAINWLLYSGADVNLKDKDDKSPMDLCEEDSPIRSMLQKYEHHLDDGPLDLCCAFIGRKQMNAIGPDGLLMFVTSTMWSERMQFIFGIRIRPYRATPPIPLRLDEQYFSDVWHYRMIRRLALNETRVKAYFRLFEELTNWEVVLKITSKKKFLGEIPVALSRYTQYNYVSFLACAELDLKDEGQFVMVKRRRPFFLMKNDEGIYTTRNHQMFNMSVPDGSLPNPPPNWNNTRYDREKEEIDAMMSELLPEEENEKSSELPSEKQINWGDKNASADVAESVSASEGDKGLVISKEQVGETREEAGQDEEEEEENWPGGIRPGTILEGDEPDESSDFYYISRGWGLYLEVIEPLPLNILIDKQVMDRNILRCCTLFYKTYHTSKAQPTQTYVVQIPKTNEFTKVGTILVFQRRDLNPGEIEYPDPDDVPEEHFLSSDGKNPWGTFWLNKEKERWSLINSGIVNKESRIIFQSNTLTAFIGVQLTQGTQKWEAEYSGDSSSEEEDQAVEGTEQEEEPPPPHEEPTEETQETPKKKKKKRISIMEVKMEEESSDDSSRIEEAGSNSEVFPTEQTEQSLTRRETRISLNEQGSNRGNALMNKSSKIGIEGKGKSFSSARLAKDTVSSPRESSVRVKEPITENDESNNQGPLNQSNNRPSASATRNLMARSSSMFERLEEQLKPEERTIASGLPPLTSSYYNLSGMRDMARKPKLIKPLKDPSWHAPSVDMQEIQPEEAAEKMDELGEWEESAPDVEEVESEELLFENKPRRYSIAQQRDDGSFVVQDFKFGPPLPELNMPETELQFLLTEVAYLWRYRNHSECVCSVFSRQKEGAYDVAVELVKASELYVRAEHWWGEGYRMIAQTPNFPIKSGRLFTLQLEGNVIIDSPPLPPSTTVCVRSLFYYLSMVSCLEYVIRRSNKDEDIKPGAKKGGKKKDDAKQDSEPDGRLEIMMYPPGTKSNGIDIANLNLFLNGPDLWHQRHVDLRSSDRPLLSDLSKVLKKERTFKHRWWRMIILMGYPEKEIETEKGKTKWSAIIYKLSSRWFEDNLNSPDRGILKLVSVLNIMGLMDRMEALLTTIREHKSQLLESKKEPRYLKLLFHWVLSTKITRNNLMRMTDTQILKPVSDIFLLRLAELLDPLQLYKIGAAMDVEDNVIHAIQDEEIIKDPVYLPFRVLIKSRQKKDEIIHYTLLLLEMTKQCNFSEAQSFLITETRKWMVTVADTEPDICAKLDNVFS